MLNVAMTVSLDLIVSCVITFRACYVSIPTDFCTGRSLCSVLNVAVTISFNLFCSDNSSTSGTLVYLSAFFHTGRRVCYFAFALNVVAFTAKNLVAIISVADVIIVFV